MAHAQTKPLACPKCGASVALIDGDVITCEHCGAEVHVPAKHVALRDAARRAAEADTEGRALYAHLAKRPSWPLRVLAGWFSPIALAVGVFPAMFIAGLGVELPVLTVASSLRPTNYFDTVPESTQVRTGIGIGFVLAYAGTILGVFGQQRAVSRQELQAALAAKPPALAGGRFGCRVCGAPLVVADGAIGAKCMYCGADNLVEVPKPWVKKIDAQAVAVTRAMHSARDASDAERARVRKKLFPYVAGISAASAGALLAFSGVGGPPPSLDDWLPDWTTHHRSSTPYVLEHGYEQKNLLFYAVSKKVPASPGAPAAGEPIATTRTTTTSQACHDGACELRWYAALARGDRLVVSLVEGPGGTLDVQPHVGHAWEADDDHLHTEPFGPTVLTRALVPGDHAEVRAERDAWYRIVLRLPGEISPRTVGMRFEITRAP
jgi:uncharacterized Zn finger protein (UPF0148 family)